MATFAQYQMDDEGGNVGTAFISQEQEPSVNIKANSSVHKLNFYKYVIGVCVLISIAFGLVLCFTLSPQGVDTTDVFIQSNNNSTLGQTGELNKFESMITVTTKNDTILLSTENKDDASTVEIEVESATPELSTNILSAHGVDTTDVFIPSNNTNDSTLGQTGELNELENMITVTTIYDNVSFSNENEDDASTVEIEVESATTELSTINFNDISSNAGITYKTATMTEKSTTEMDDFSPNSRDDTTTLRPTTLMPSETITHEDITSEEDHDDILEISYPATLKTINVNFKINTTSNMICPKKIGEFENKTECILIYKKQHYEELKKVKSNKCNLPLNINYPAIQFFNNESGSVISLSNPEIVHNIGKMSHNITIIPDNIALKTCQNTCCCSGECKEDLSKSNNSTQNFTISNIFGDKPVPKSVQVVYRNVTQCYCDLLRTNE